MMAPAWIQSPQIRSSVKYEMEKLNIKVIMIIHINVVIAMHFHDCTNNPVQRHAAEDSGKGRQLPGKGA